MSTQIAGEFTRQEILSQPSVWAEALTQLDAQAEEVRAFLQRGQVDQIVFTGCGSTYYLGIAAAAVTQALTGLPARSLPGSELWLNPAALPARGGRQLLVAVSRSGATTETLAACAEFRRRGQGDILTLSCYPGRALTQLGDLNLVFPAAQEESVAQTRAFTTLYLATIALAALWSDQRDLAQELHRLPSILAPLMDRHQASLAALGAELGIERFYFLGSGVQYGLACELSLKMKEMTLSHSEPFHTMEFRHGPKSMITPETLVVGLVAGARRADDMAVLREMQVMGARTLTLGEAEADVAFASGLGEIARSVLYLPFGQLVALGRALAKGLDPDSPTNLDAVVVLDRR